jgi:hypothetical protein
MNCSAEKASRKSTYGAFGRTAMVLVIAVAISFGMLAEPAVAARRALAFPWDNLFAPPRPRPHRAVHRAAVVPLPKPRPAEAPAPRPPEPPAAAEKTPPADHGKAADKAPVDKAPADKAPEPAPPPPPSACRQALTEEIAIAPSVPAIHGPGDCGGDDLVRLEAIVLPDNKRPVAVKPAAILRCTMATAIADWVRSDIAPLAAGLGGTISELDNLDSFQCRGRNGVPGAQLSEHGRANALDVRAFKLANGRSISLTDRTVARDLRENMLHSACTRFTTVLGPGSDGYHEDHIHLDRMERRNNYRICQWDVLDPLPAVAPLLPAERPGEAPPRQVAAKNDPKTDIKSEARTDAKSDASKSENTKAEKPKSHAGKSDGAESKRATTKPQPTKKRRQSRRP